MHILYRKCRCLVLSCCCVGDVNWCKGEWVNSTVQDLNINFREEEKKKRFAWQTSGCCFLMVNVFMFQRKELICLSTVDQWQILSALLVYVAAGEASLLHVLQWIHTHSLLLWRTSKTKMGACPSSASSTRSVECQQTYPKSCKFENALCLYTGMYCFHIATAQWIWLFKTESTSGFGAAWNELSTGKLLTTNSCAISVLRNSARCWRVCFVPFGNSTLKTPGHTRCAAESERIGMVDYNSVFIQQKNSA